MTSRHDLTVIRRALEILIEPGQVVELRALGASTPRIRRPHTVSGYFDDMDALAKAAADLPKAKGIYITPHPVNPALLSRARNRLRAPDRQDPLTSDRDVIGYRWLLIDCDPVRPAGISSTDAEHELALTRMRDVHAWLQAQGWPAGIEADSGNGGHLLFRVDEPNTDASAQLLKRCLAALAQRFDDEHVTIDRSVYNPARIWKLYGTLAGKGDDTPDRPHRLSRVLACPPTLDIVSHAHLDALAEAVPGDDRQEAERPGHHSSFDLARWILEAELDIEGPEPWGDGRRWVFPVCPWNPEHTNRSAYIVQHADGAIGAGCHHNSCADKDWHALRDLVEPGWRERRRPADDPHASAERDREPEAHVPPWPTLDPAALYGLPGEIVRAIDPHTEADPAALLTQILIFFGNAIGRNPHCLIESDYHGLSEFLCLVGATAKARKGTSEGHVRRLFHRVDPAWVETRIVGGLSSGEGLIYAVRDPTDQPGEADQGVADKRLLVIEAELASTLRVLGRDGNTLSAVLRNAWDGRPLSTMTRHAPIRAIESHISVIGHITRAELLRYLDRTEAANGLGNRFLWVCVRRSKLLPEGGHLDPAVLNGYVVRLRQALDHAATVGTIVRDAVARGIWAEVYGHLSAERPGLFGAMIGRAEAHVMRLSALYALLDGSAVVRAEHLHAALALWEYCEASARFIFGDALGDPLADDILEALRLHPDGMTRNDLMDYFDRHRSSEQIGQALKLLSEQGLVTLERQRTTGRPRELWKAIRNAR